MLCQQLSRCWACSPGKSHSHMAGVAKHCLIASLPIYSMQRVGPTGLRQFANDTEAESIPLAILRVYNMRRCGAAGVTSFAGMETSK